MNLTRFVGAVVGGGGALIAQYWGKEDKAMVKNLFGMILKWSVAISLDFFALAMIIPEQLMRIYTPDKNLIEIGASYLRPGALKLKDTNGDGKPDKHCIANTIPNWQGGFSLNGYLYGIDFSANFNFALDYHVYNANKVEFTSSRKFTNRNLVKEMNVENRWTNVDWETGELITDPDVLASVNANTTMWSPFIGQAVITDWAMEDASFLRLQSATIGYTFPEKWMSKIHVRKLRIYVTGTNLFCLTKYSGYDPEVNTRRTTPLTPGVDYSAYPKSRGFVAGINLTF